VRFRQIYYGPTADASDVYGAGIDIYMSPTNVIWHVLNEYLPNISVKDRPKTTPQGCADAVRKTLNLAAFAPPVEAVGPLVLAQQQPKGDVYVHRLVFALDKPFGTWEILVSAADCAVLGVRDLVRYFDGVGNVFDPNPILPAPPKMPQRGRDAAALAQHRDLTDLTTPDTLTGRYADTARTAEPVHNVNRLFVYEPPAAGFAQTMAYFHVTEALKRFLSLLTPIAGRPAIELPIRIDAFGQCRNEGLSCYQPRGPRGRVIILGRAMKGIADAEDGHVIIHELGHALLGQLSPDFEVSTRPLSLAMAEGFADYLALRMWAGTNAESLCFAPWYASRDAAQAQCLRRIQLGEKPAAPQWDRQTAPWEYAHLWSSTLWGLRQFLRGPVGLGDSDIDRIIFRSHTALTLNATHSSVAIKAVNHVLEVKGSESIANEVAKFLTTRGFLLVQD
jgi:hypothetical protein